MADHLRHHCDTGTIISLPKADVKLRPLWGELRAPAAAAALDCDQQDSGGDESDDYIFVKILLSQPGLMKTLFTTAISGNKNWQKRHCSHRARKSTT